MDTLVTPNAKTHQVAFIVRAAVRQRQFMMYQGSDSRFLFGEALLAKRMSLDVSVSYFFPSSAVAFAVIITSGKTLVVLLHIFSMFLAVAAFMFRQIRTAVVFIRSLWFSWHNLTSIRAIKNLRRDFLFGGCLSIFAEYIISHGRAGTQDEH